MRGGVLERTESLPLVHEALLMGETVSKNVGRRRKNGLAYIFQGMSQEDINKIRTHSFMLNRRSSSCPCGSGDKISEQQNSKQRFHLLYNKRWARRRMALGDIFTSISTEGMKRLLHGVQDERLINSRDLYADNENIELLSKRRFAFADIFTDIPEENVKKLLDGSLDQNNGHRTQTRSKEGNSLVAAADSIEMKFKRTQCRRRFALGNIFMGIPEKVVENLINKNKHESIDEITVLQTRIELKDEQKLDNKSSGVSCGNTEVDKPMNEVVDKQNDMYMKTFFRSLIERHQKQRLGHLNRRMSLPCCSQFDMAQRLSKDSNTDGLWGALSDESCHDNHFLKGHYVSNVVFASC